MHLEISHLIIESDCQVVANEIQTSDQHGELGNLLSDIKEWMGKFLDCQIQFAHRGCNMVAHTLAHFAWNVSNISVWYGVEPEFLSQFVWFDKLGL